ncbi:MAG: hypothetical protein KC619_24900 [Myxococcales bacterium]|nr:hypothetical protein [Myxococcales bacterium]
MILELLIGAGIVAAGAAAARVIVRRRAAGAEDDDALRDEKPKAKRKREAKRETPAPAGPRGLRVGDVLLYADTELWLAGCVSLDEEGFVAKLFPCPGAERAEFVAQLDPDAKELATLRPTDEVPDGPVPESLPIDGRRVQLESRGVAEIRTEGEHLPRTTERASYAILSDVGGRLLVVVDFVKGKRLALVGDRVSRHMVDLLPGGDLEPNEPS